jgi:hypothetical protein
MEISRHKGRIKRRGSELSLFIGTHVFRSTDLLEFTKIFVTTNYSKLKQKKKRKKKKNFMDSFKFRVTSKINKNKSTQNVATHETVGAT